MLIGLVASVIEAKRVKEGKEKGVHHMAKEVSI